MNTREKNQNKTKSPKTKTWSTFKCLLNYRTPGLPMAKAESNEDSMQNIRYQESLDT